jgi:hypothetical protein
MSNVRSIKRPFAVLISVLVTLALALMAGSAVSTSQAATGATAPTARPVAQNGQGEMTSRIVGETANGRSVTGSFTPIKFIKRDGKVKVRGLLRGVVHQQNGSTRTFGVMRSMRVKSINGQPASARALAVCEILHLVLGPLDLDLLGLQVHLDRVVLNIDAQSGPGNLLGNLLCAVAGLLDGGLQGALGRLVQLLNRILGQLGLGL